MELAGGSSFCGALFQARLSVPPAVSLRGGMQACGHLRRMLWCYLEQVIADAVQRDLSLVPAWLAQPPLVKDLRRGARCHHHKASEPLD